MEDKMPWPLQPADLTDDKIPLPESLSTFMNVLLSGKHVPCQIARGIYAKLSIIFYDLNVVKSIVFVLDIATYRSVVMHFL